VRTMKKRLRRGLTAIAEWCRENRHKPVEEQQKTLNAKLRGHYQYYGIPTNSMSMWRFYREVAHLAEVAQSPNSRKALTWERYTKLLRCHPLLLPRIAHPWYGAGVVPEEPLRGNLHGGICEGRECRSGQGGPKRARSWKRRTQPRNTYSTRPLFYSERCPVCVVNQALQRL